MSAIWDWPGSRWWRVDLHAHSPASYDFKPEADRNAKDWAAWVSAAQSARLDAVAVTDHNTAEGVEAIQRAAENVPGAPVIFPGVEITANDGTHLLVVFDPHSRQSHVEEFLGLARIPVGQRGRDTARSPLSVEQILDLDCEPGVLVLGAHINGLDGLLLHDGQQRLAELKHERLIAVELDPACDLDSTWLDGSRNEVGRVIPQIWCSDSHAFSEAGRRFTWVKMTQPDAEGLRLALLDGKGSLLPVERPDSWNPNAHADSAIESITVHQAKYMGRRNGQSTPEPLTVRFNPWLNAVIGGRGTGKSTLIDLCRATLRRESELNHAGDTSLRAAFDKRMRVPANRFEEGLLTAETVVEVVYRKAGERFLLSWDPQGQTTPISRLEGDRFVAEEGDIRERFPVRIYSQKQLFDLAKAPNALLTVIDDTPQVRGGEVRRLLKEAEARYLALRAEARALHAQAAEIPARRATLKDMQRKLELLQEGGHAKSLHEYRTRRRQDGTWDSIRQAATDAVEAVGSAAEGLAVADLDLGPEAAADGPTASLRRAHEELRSLLTGLREKVLAAVESARTGMAGLLTDEDALAWQAAVRASEHEYQQVARQLAEAGIANPDEYRDLLQRTTALEQEVGTLGQLERIAADREGEAAAVLTRYRDLRRDLTERRKAFTEQCSGDLVKVEILADAGRGNLEEFLREALGISRFDDDYRALGEQILPAADQSWSFEKLEGAVEELRATLASPDRQLPTRDRRFETALRKLPPERLDRLALYHPDDTVNVSFRDPRGGKPAWQPLAKGSPGQQTAALLAFVLGYGHEPILLDQPEDDLDNTLIYKLLVQRLREQKATRQVIVVTHNPNIVVHGDAELVVSFEARGGQTQIEVSGGLQEKRTRDEICRIMEGGRKAFKTRYRRIMLTGGGRDGSP